MSNEEKKPLEQVDASVETNESVNTPAKANEGGWWKNLSKGIKAAIISGISCVLVAAVVLCVVLLGGKGPDGPDGPGGNSGGNGKTAAYSITIVTKGGMAFSQLPVYIYEYEDGFLGDMVDGGYGSTDENGKVTFNLSEGKQYAAKIDNGIPDGYDAASFYPLVSSELNITVSSAVIPETSITGVTYNIGSVMHDFTVNSTVLVDDGNGGLKFEEQVFTLSEALKDKKAVLINFWYTTCSWCIEEFPYMQSAYEKYSDDIAIIALDPYADDNLALIKTFQAEHGLTFNVAQETFGLANAFNVTGYPTSVMVDRYGVVTMVEAGAIPSERAFNLLFEYYSAENYEQKLIASVNELVPKEKPDVEMAPSNEISQIFDKGAIGNVTYLPYPNDASAEEKEYSWPFLIDQLDINGQIYDVLKTSNAFKEGSFCQMLFNVDLNVGDVLAFDYLASTERGADILYVVVDGKDIYSISGQGTGWENCYAFVAEEAGNYEVGLVYAKDSSDDVGEDTVFLKDLRIVTEADIDSPTYIYRFAATNPDKYSNYQDYVIPVLGSDGYYHVNTANGPILLADLMGYTRFSEESSAYLMAEQMLTDKHITEAEYNRIVQYCSYASNGSIYGVSPVTPELKDLLNKIVAFNGGNPDNENDWQRFCCYYDAYGTDGKQLEDPIKGLSPFSAYDVIESTANDKDYPNSFTYDRVIMPRGLYGKFTPAVSGTYMITTYAPNGDQEGFVHETEAWVFTLEGFDAKEPWYTYEHVDRNNTVYYMMLYLEAGKDYYIDIAFADVEQYGTINYRIERIGGEGYFRFTQASPGPFTSLESVTGELTETIIRGITVELDANGFWREKREDGRLGSIIYVDFTNYTVSFNNNVIYSANPDRVDMIKAGAFNFKFTEEDLYVLKYLEKVGGDVERCKTELRAELGDAYNAKYTDYDANDMPYTVTGFAVEEVLAGTYHGVGNDETETMLKYAEKMIKVGDTITTVSADGTTVVEEVILEGDARIGCVAVDAELAEILQKLMDKYTFEGVKYSWLKLCYYEQYFCAATPK